MAEVLTLAGPDAQGVTHLTLTRPERANAFDDALALALLQALETLHGDGTRVLVVRGAGNNFSGGFDFTGFEQASEGDLLLRFVRLEQALHRLWTAPFVSVACIQGAAFGAGADLAAACTWRIGVPSARFRFPGYRFGVALGTSRLAAVIGEGTARDILLTDRTLDAPAALAAGLLTHLVEEAAVEPLVATLIDGFASLDDVALKDLLRNVCGTSFDGDRELAALVRSLARPRLSARIARYRETPQTPAARRPQE